ncbi:TapB family protein [Porphyromonas gingivalis]|uniref:DUF3108 domain-containing protein n=1 Tax=Porphyromonas gingivalis (strain ATCC 33277 / DSM 20709 / CIP 103683 / JCM 12257 / NCTC 11834 / 2561) TaxID=431947 RepID=B2RH25_PORG3|nr:hypothetical protein [Porphyromonas gingivalis]AIJ35021.1 hypothetical protein EG14_02730 [Porphyromonas gingivalis]ALJ24638.1 hypothetical protein PGF_00001500 [Porphyromonas gingivalis 381]AUR49809.1 hypothetical protein CF001_0151 [Porphyromonas gingivalis ATCC 33277]MDR4975921.1 hypothetical protein [Porphyromonas gingivalis]SJL19225.1 hypothetical protein PGIN_3-3_00355 [Porphyromonas gingivalis]
MKYRSIILSFFLLMPVSNCFADMQGYCMPQSWVGKIGQKAKEKVEKRVEEKVDKAMDKTLDKAEEEATRGRKRATTAPAPKTARKTISLQELEQETDRKTHHIGNTGKSVGRATGKNGCEILFPVKQGTRREMTIYEANGKVSGTIRQQVQSVTNTAKGMKITTAQEMYDKKGKQIFSDVANMWCDGDRFYVDAQSLLNEQTLKMFKDIKYKVTGVDIAYPSRMSAGQSLPDAEVTITAEAADFPLPPITLRTIGRKVQGIESITTPAGTFECYKISYSIVMESMITVQMSAVEWMSKDVGCVKSESYDKKGKLVGSTLLTKLE